MLKVKNIISNSKENKEQRRFNSYMRCKEFIRLKLLKFKPLSNKEKYMYYPINRSRKSTSIDKGKYFAFNKRIHILSAVNKNDLSKFYNGYRSLAKEHPSKGFGGTIISDQTKEMITFYSSTLQYAGTSNLGTISPTTKELLGIVDFIEIILFDLSDTYMGVSFVLTLNEEFNDEINQMIINEPSDEISYNKFRVGKKIHINKIYLNKDNLRSKKLDDILLEIKMRSYDFLSSYFNLLPIHHNSPITLDEYSTNYHISENNPFLRAYDFFLCKEHVHHDFDIIVNLDENNTSKQKYVKTDFLFDCFYSKSTHKNRKARIVYELPEEYKDNFVHLFDLITLYKVTFHFFLNYELNCFILEKNQLLYDTYKRNARIFKTYLKINKTINVYNDILSTLHTDNFNDSYHDTTLNKSLSYAQDSYKMLEKKDNSIDPVFSNLIMLKSNRLSILIAAISTFIALFSLIFSLFFNNN